MIGAYFAASGHSTSTHKRRIEREWSHHSTSTHKNTIAGMVKRALAVVIGSARRFSAWALSRLRGSAVHVVFALLLVEFAFLFRGRILVLLVLADEVVHVAFRLRELHLVHALAGVPMQKGFAAEHGREKVRHALEHFLDGR